MRKTVIKLLLNTKVLLTLIFLLGLFLRFSYPTLIEFFYDPALFSEATIKILENNDYLNARGYYALVDNYATGAYSVGPLYHYLSIPFILITKNPVILSMMMAFLNSLAILLCYLIGKNFFNKNIGLISAALYAVNPWAIIFSRNVIPYGFIQIFIAIFIFSLFDVVHKDRSRKIALCLISSLVLIQLIQWGLLTPFILIFAFIFLRPKINWKFFFIGLIICLILLFPHIYWDIEHDYHDSKNLIKAVSKLSFGQGNFFSKFEFSRTYHYFDYYLKIGSAQKFEHHLGYALTDFLNTLHPIVKFSIKLEYFLIFFGFMFVLVKLIQQKTKAYLEKDKTKKPLLDSYVLLLIWVLVTLIAFIIFQPENLSSLPRYYLFFFPSQFIFISLILDKLYGLYKSKKSFVSYLSRSLIILVLLLIIVSNSIFIISYFRFLPGYNYNKWLTHKSDIPYKFSYDALDYIEADSRSKGYQFITVSNDIRKPDLNDPNPGVHYLMNYVLYNWYDEKSLIKDKTIHYYIINGRKGEDNLPKDIENISYKKFGPYYVFSEKELIG